MLNRIIKFSLDNKLVIIITALLLLLAGSYTAIKMEVDVFPDLTAPTVVVMTEAPGMAPEEVERLVSFPIETAVNGATDIRRVRSSSAMGLSMVWVEFDWNTDIYNARQTVTERLIQVRDKLPTGTQEPVIAPQSSLMGEILIFGMTSESIDSVKLRTIAEWNVRPRLLSVGGVAQVSVTGGELKQYQIYINPDKMRYYNVSLKELIDCCKDANENASGGFYNQYGTEYIITGVTRSNDVEEIGNSMVKMFDDLPVLIRDVAIVKTGGAPKIGDGSVNAKDAIIVMVTKQPHINTLELTDDINDAIEKIGQTIPEIEFHTGILEQAQFIGTSVNNIKTALIEGSIFVVIVLFLFLLNGRTTLISILAIPLSLLASVLFLKAIGITINTMTLGGMTIAIGSLVDDAIIDVENVFKRLRENVGLPKAEKQNPLIVVYEASKEIRSSILNATIIIIVAFIPLFFLSGMEGRMLRPLGISYIVALGASLLIALTLTPVLCSVLLTNEKRLKKLEKGSWVERNLRKWYSSGLEVVMRHKKIVIGTSLTLLIAAILLFFTFGRDFLPPLNEGSLTISTSSLPGISLDESNNIGRTIEKKLLEFPEVSRVARRTGRAELSEHTFSVNVSELDVPFELIDRSRDDFLEDLRDRLSLVPGVNSEVGQPITHRINHMLSGSKAAIAVKLFGSDLTQLYSIASNIRDNIDDIEGIADLNVEQLVEIPQIRIKPNRTMLARYGISLNEFNNFISFALGGEKVSDVFEDEKAFDLVLRFDEPYRNNFDVVRNAMIDGFDGQKIPLYYVAEVVSTTGPNTINRENVQRKIVVSINSDGRDLGSLVADIKTRINETITLPENYWIEYGGQFKSAESASKTLLLTSLLAILVVFMILYQEFKNAKIAGVILLNLPLALIGGVAAIYITSGIVSVPAIIGFITLFGIATRNGILLVSRYQHLREQGLNLLDAVINGSLDRLNPILITALTATLALIPLAIAGEKSGNEIQSPMAIVILGGLLSSTLLNVFVVPVVFYLVNLKKSE